MAGAEAEVALLGHCSGGDEYDRHEIAMMLDSMGVADDADCERQEARLRQATRQVVRRHVGKIERLARALAAYGTLDNEDVIRAVAGLPPAPVEVDWWAMQFDGAEEVEVVSLAGAPAGMATPDDRHGVAGCFGAGMADSGGIGEDLSPHPPGDAS